jgi:hypothetical protein
MMHIRNKKLKGTNFKENTTISSPTKETIRVANTSVDSRSPQKTIEPNNDLCEVFPPNKKKRTVKLKVPQIQTFPSFKQNVHQTMSPTTA